MVLLLCVDGFLAPHWGLEGQEAKCSLTPLTLPHLTPLLLSKGTGLVPCWTLLTLPPWGKLREDQISAEPHQHHPGRKLGALVCKDGRSAQWSAHWHHLVDNMGNAAYFCSVGDRWTFSSQFSPSVTMRVIGKDTFPVGVCLDKGNYS